MPESATLLGQYPADTDPTEGRRLLDEMAAGRLPIPHAADRLGLPRPTTWSPGRVVAVVHVGDDILLPAGVAFGGYIACLVDHVAGLAMYSVLPDTGTFLTATLEVGYRAPLRSGDARIEATVRRRGSRQAVVEVTIVQSGQLTCRATVEQVVRLSPPPVDAPR
jgi:uncharacterized protein (TIGR00369 family)